MYSSLACVALACFSVATAPVPEPTWHTDYSRAQEMGISAKKPLAVFFSEGDQGQLAWSRDGKLTKNATTLLARDYVCVYIDLSSEAGRDLANRFAISNKRGLVISDRTGGYQAFHHNGALGNDELNRCLERFADPNAVFRSTITHLTQRPNYQYSYYGNGSNYTPVYRGTANC